MAPRMMAVTLLATALALAGCGPSLKGKYQDVANDKKFFDFSSGGSWVDQDGDKGKYKLEGETITMTGITTYDGKVVGPEEIHLFNVPWGGDDKFNTYRRAHD